MINIPLIHLFLIWQILTNEFPSTTAAAAKKSNVGLFSRCFQYCSIFFSPSDLPPEHNRIDLLQVFNIFLCNHFASWFFERNKCLIQWQIINTSLVPGVTFCYIMPFGSNIVIFFTSVNYVHSLKLPVFNNTHLVKLLYR